jgi:hypothetical protein
VTRSRWLLVLLPLVGLLLGGCGVPTDAAPRALDPAQAPAGALPSPSPAPVAVGDERVVLHFVKDERLVPVERPVTSPTSTAGLLELLLAGPTEAEKNAGLTSLIPAALSVESVEQQGRVAVITLQGAPDQVRPQAMAFAQIVATLTPDRATGVRFRMDGADLRVPRSDGSLSDAPVDRADYADLLLPRPASSPLPTAGPPGAPLSPASPEAPPPTTAPPTG